MLESVAVIAASDLLVRRVGDALSSDSISIGYQASEVALLSDGAVNAAAIILAGSLGAVRRETLLRAAAARFPGVPAVIVGSLSANALRKALEAGALGVVVEGDLEATLAPTLRAVCAGQVVVPPRMRRAAVQPVLSYREKQTLALVVAGLTNRQIAARLYLAESTVKTHLTSIFAKLGVRSRNEAVAVVLDPDQKLGAGILALAPSLVAAATEDGRP